MLLDKIQNFIQWFKNEPKLRKVEHILLFLFLYSTYKNLRKGDGMLRNIAKNIIRQISQNPLSKNLVQKGLESEVNSIAKKMFEGKPLPIYEKMPKTRQEHTEIWNILTERYNQNVNNKEGKTFAYVYIPEEKHCEFLAEVFKKFVHTNALNPMQNISLRNMEVEVVSMTANILHGNSEFVGNITTGGTESIFLAMKAYRDYFISRNPDVERTEVIICKTGHPGFIKAAQILKVDLVYVDFDQNTMKMRVDQIESKITKRTSLVVCSAPQYPHGTVDPISEASQIVDKYKIPIHIDAAIGGFILPWIEKLGNKVPLWDFRVKNVMSIGLDVHKYGYAPKGSSVLVFRDKEIRQHHFAVSTKWPGGLYISPTFLGTRSGGTIASAWASLMALGEEGFMEITKIVMDTVNYLKSEIKQMGDDIFIPGNPESSIISLQSRNEKVNIYHISDALEELGWNVERQQYPSTIHCTIMPQHFSMKEKFIQDLKQSLESVKKTPEKYKKQSAAMYGMVASIPDELILDDFLLKFLNKTYTFKVE